MQLSSNLHYSGGFPMLELLITLGWDTQNSTCETTIICYKVH